jgi:uncharacterized membrane-anchored protein YhcB (DUF1043 family)
VLDLATMVLGLFEIDRFKNEKLKLHNNIISEMAKIQLEIAKLRKDLYSHILDNHNLM